jgi:hypothetical protein
MVAAMEQPSRILSALLRISGVLIAQADLESILGVSLDAHESSHPFGNYAQIYLPIEKDMTEDNIWHNLVDLVRTIGPKISTLKHAGSIGDVRVDLLVEFDDRKMAVNIVVPSYAAEAIGRHGIEIELSVCLTHDHDCLNS